MPKDNKKTSMTAAMEGKIKRMRQTKKRLTSCRSENVLAVALIAVISMIFLNAMTESRDGRHSVISAEDSNEYNDQVMTDDEIRLQNILECISGAGEVRVMINGSESSKNASSVFASSVPDSGTKKENGGVIVVAEGGGDPNVCSRITDAVSTVCGIRPSEVVVFELCR